MGRIHIALNHLQANYKTQTYLRSFMNHQIKRNHLIILIFSMILSSCAGSIGNETDSDSLTIPAVTMETLEESITSTGIEETTIPEVEDIIDNVDEFGLTYQQRNSYSMLYFLAINQPYYL